MTIETVQLHGRTLLVRKIPFDFSNGTGAIWNKARPEWNHMLNGGSLTMPYLEPFLIRNAREALKHVTDQQLKEDVRSFCSQEAQHFQNHRNFNEMLKANGYPKLAAIESQMEADYSKLNNKSLKWRLAYTAGFETMTIGLTAWLIGDRHKLFGGADTSVTSLILWHMVEETEHKNVAYDLYQELYGDYFMRLRGLFYAIWHIASLTRKGYILMLKQDGRWYELKSRMQLWAMVWRFTRRVSPSIVRAMRKNYHPSQVIDIAWVDEWREAYANLPNDVVPLLDTNDPEMPAQFG